jgi:hypothetical protein
MYVRIVRTALLSFAHPNPDPAPYNINFERKSQQTSVLLTLLIYSCCTSAKQYKHHKRD